MAPTTMATDLPLTGKEQAQWMLHQLAPGRGICNIGFALRIGKTLRWWPLQEALNHVLRRHPALRATVRATGPRLRKHIGPAEAAELPLATHAGAEDSLDELITGLVGESFDVEDGPLINAHLIILPTGCVVCVVLHHLVGDAITVQIVMRELAALYDAFADGRDVPDELRGQVPPRAEEAPAADVVAYWRKHLDGVDVSTAALAGARQTQGRPTFAGDRLDIALSPEAVAAVGRLRTRTRATDNIVLLAVYYLLLARHGAGPDLVVGVLANARRGRTESNVVGYHANMLPVRVRVDPDDTFAALALATREAFLGGLEHGDLSFESLQHELDTRSVDWRVPLFRHSFNFRPTSYGHMTIGGAGVEAIDAYHGLSRLDLELIVWTEPNVVNMTAVFSTEVHDGADIAAMLARFESTLLALDAGYDLPLREIDVMTAADRELVRRANRTRRDWGTETVPRLIARNADLDTIAVGHTTYRELMAAAAGVRAELIGRGVEPGDVVGLHATRGPVLAAAVLGVWAAGAAYLPLDPAHPAQRAAVELEDANVRVVLADRDVPADRAGSRAVVRLDRIAPRTEGIHWTPGPLAYVIYTSGSTGRPKGVEITHDNLVNVVRHFAELLDVDADDRVLWLTTFSFDISALELLVPLVRGARVVVAPDEARLDPAALAELIESASVSIVQATPTTWRQLAPGVGERLRGLRVLCGGEPLTPALAERLLAGGCRLFNVYGPTETTIWSTAVELTSPVGERVPIGTPISNTEVHVLDTAGLPLPPGQPGELCVAGAGVAVGYRGDAGRTAERFREDGPHGRHYRTGDQVRQRLDGGLEFLGRTDRQVKVRGHRIELGEVEVVLEEHDAVLGSAVFTERDLSGNLRLVAAVRSDLPPEELRAHAVRGLPAAAVPARFVPVRAFPMTGNDKVDHRALARLVAASGAVPAPELPSEPLPRTVVELWRVVLGDDGLSAESNFFLAGGHSVLAVELAERISAVTPHRVTFDMIFDWPTPAQLCAGLTGERS